MAPPLKNDTVECIGLIPAGGRAERISPLPCSKEIFPVGFGEIKQKGRRLPKVAAHYLLEKMQLAEATKAYFVLAKGKWDIPAYFGDGSIVNMAIGYLVTEVPYGVPFTIDSAFSFLKNKRILFGFPDIILQPHDVYTQLIDRMQSSNADIVLGLFGAKDPAKMDMVDLSADGTICGIQIKPERTRLKWTWIIAVWNFSFTQFIHEYVQQHLVTIAAEDGRFKENRHNHKEIYLGDVIQKAIESDMKIDKVMFNTGTYIDIGSPEDMMTAIETQALQSISRQGKGTYK
jgi:glucose-1-phosphate thymidylyltransferase